MSNELEEAERDIVAQRAAQWLVRLNENKSADRPAFVQWLKRSPRHVEEFLLMSAVCRGLKGAGPADLADIEQLLAEASEAPSNVVSLSCVNDERDDAEPRHGEHTDTNQKQRLRDSSNRRTFQWLSIAAGLAILGLSLYWTAPQIAARINTYSTAIGEQRAVRLPDGSVVYMNAQSRLSVSYTGQARDIELLGGEAIFKVERVPNRPFRVHTRTTTIQALGTQFNVYRRAEGDTVVSVIDGAVRVSKESRGPTVSTQARIATRTLEPPTTLRLSAGEEARVAPSGAIVKHQRADLSRATAWRERRLVFREDRLEDIAAEFARYSPHRIVLEDEAARNKRITGTFDADDPASLMQFLARLDEFSVDTTAWEFIVRER